MADNIQLVDQLLAGNAAERERLIALRASLVAAGVITWMRPTEDNRITQVFGNDPVYYGQYNLPGHEGIDWGTRTPAHPDGKGSNIFAADRGKIVEVLQNHPAYGVCVRQTIRAMYAGQFRDIRVTYAHGLPGSVKVTVGQVVERGTVLMLSDSTGNVRGAHLHTTASILGYVYIDEHGNRWPNGIIDPSPLFGI